MRCPQLCTGLHPHVDARDSSHRSARSQAPTIGAGHTDRGHRTHPVVTCRYRPAAQIAPLAMRFQYVWPTTAGTRERVHNAAPPHTAPLITIDTTFKSENSQWMIPNTIKEAAQAATTTTARTRRCARCCESVTAKVAATINSGTPRKTSSSDTTPETNTSPGMLPAHPTWTTVTDRHSIEPERHLPDRTHAR